MKKIAIVLASALLLAACTGKQDEKKAEQERDSLIAVISERDASLNNLITSFSGIERTLDSINIRQRNILIMTKNPGEMKGTLAEEINKEILAINDLIEKNKKDISNLNAEVKTLKGKNNKLEELVETLNSQLADKQKDLANLSTELTRLDIEVMQLQSTIGLLQSKNNLQADVIESEAALLHVAYYVANTSKNLMNDKIIDKKGGLLGMGKTKELKEDFDESKFIKIDYTKTLTIMLGCKKVEIVTNHPTESYTLEKDKDKKIVALKITDPEAFWKASKYLVIVKSE